MTEDVFIEVSSESTLLQIFSIKDYILPQVPEIVIISKKSNFWSYFMK